MPENTAQRNRYSGEGPVAGWLQGRQRFAGASLWERGFMRQVKANKGYRGMSATILTTEAALTSAELANLPPEFYQFFEVIES